MVKIYDEIKDEVFKEKKTIKLTKENIEEFLESFMEAGKKVGKDKREQKERAIDGKEYKPEDLEQTAEVLVKDIAHHLNFVDWLQALINKRKDRKQDEVDLHKVELCHLLHSLSVKLRMATMFGFGKISGAIAVIDTTKLPSIEEAKKKNKEELKGIWDSATDSSGKIDNKSTKVFKKKGDVK